jgi:phosphotransferase system HPr-like phosphotransfer protein
MLADWITSLELVSVVLKQGTRVTITAVNKDERHALLLLQELSPARVRAVVLSQSQSGEILKGGL